MSNFFEDVQKIVCNMLKLSRLFIVIAWFSVVPIYANTAWRGYIFPLMIFGVVSTIAEFVLVKKMKYIFLRVVIMIIIYFFITKQLMFYRQNGNALVQSMTDFFIINFAILNSAVWSFVILYMISLNNGINNK
jgi:hypothetical protein